MCWSILARQAMTLMPHQLAPLSFKGADAFPGLLKRDVHRCRYLHVLEGLDQSRRHAQSKLIQAQEAVIATKYGHGAARCNYCYYQCNIATIVSAPAAL